MSRTIQITDKPGLPNVHQCSHKSAVAPKENGTTQQIIQSLKNAFQLNQNTIHLICSNQNIAVIDDALQNWLNELLFYPDHKMGLLLMPLIAQRFDEYLNLLKRQNR